MTVDINAVRIFIRPGYTDLRKAVNGLATIIEEQMEQDLLSGSLYLFCNRRRKLLKVIWWDKTGFWLSQKRLEKDIFPWPEHKRAVEELSTDEVKMLLAGIDFWKAHKPIYYTKVS